eukprot:UC4_evm3s991
MDHLTILAPRWTRQIAGFMPWSVIDYVVEDSYVHVGDDAVAIMSGNDEDGHRWTTASVVFRRLYVRGRSVAIGSAVSGNVTDILFENCTIGDDAGSSPWAFKIKMHANDPSIVSGVHFKNTKLGNITSNTWQDPNCYPAIEMGMNYDGAYVDPEKHQPQIRNISFVDVNTTYTCGAVGSLIGIKKDAIAGLHFEDSLPRESGFLFTAIVIAGIFENLTEVHALNSVKSGRKSPINILMLVADDLRPELGCYGIANAETPRLDELAKESLVLARNYVQQSVCGPTRASFLTGRRPDSLHTVTHTKPTYWRSRAGNFTSLQNGYYTLSFGKVFDLRTSSNASAGWICDAPFSWSEYPVFCGTDLWVHDGELAEHQSHATLSPIQEANMSDKQIVNAAISRFSSTNHSVLPYPWFVAVGLHRPHLPLIVPQWSLDLHPTSGIILPQTRYSAPKSMPFAATECSGGEGCEPGHGSMELWQQYTYNKSIKWDGWTGKINTSIPDEWSINLKRYYKAAVSHTDSLFGRLIDAVKARGDYGNTIVVVLGDHGWHLSEHAQWCKCTNFEPAVRAPLIIRIPGVTNMGTTSYALTEHVDIFPTLAEATGFPIPECPHNSSRIKVCSEGVSLLPLVKSPGAIVKKASFSQWPHPFSSQTPAAMGYSIRTETARYTEFVFMKYDADGTHIPDWSRRCAREYYNYSIDPEETTNFAEYLNQSDGVMFHAKLLRLGWIYAKGLQPWPNLPPPINQTVFPECPCSRPDPNPPVPPAVSRGFSRKCSNISAQKNPSDPSCWCKPAHIAIGPKDMSWSDCKNICASDVSCRAWTFDSDSGCFRHSTSKTFLLPHNGSDANKIWSGCEHPDTSVMVVGRQKGHTLDAFTHFPSTMIILDFCRDLSMCEPSSADASPWKPRTPHPTTPPPPQPRSLVLFFVVSLLKGAEEDTEAVPKGAA